MPEIKRFSSFKVLMFFHDENPPHVHVKGADYAAKVRISNGNLLAGDAPGSEASTPLGRGTSGRAVGAMGRIPEVRA
jgi:hypothetical protein